MTFKEYRYLVLSDLYRVAGKANSSSLIWWVVLGGSFKYLFWLRTCRYLREKRGAKYLAYPFGRVVLNRYAYRYGISIPVTTEIGSGFYIGHFGSIIVHGSAVIGKNCNISQGVTLGQANRGRNKGHPVIGDNVYIGPGAKIVGAVNVGNNVAIGANCVVTKDIPDNSVVVGIPGRVISSDGSMGYVNRTDYDEESFSAF